MLLSIVLLVAGVVLLVFSADRAVGYAEAISESLGISPVIVGALVVGLGTSLPEMVVSGVAAAQRDTIDLAVGNLVGSNAANLTLVLGTAAVITTVMADKQVFRREGALMFAASVLISALLFDNELNRWEGIVLLVGMITAAWIIAVGSSGEASETIEIHASVDRAHLRKTFVWAVAALAGVVIGAQLLVTGAVDIATDLGASEAFVGLTIVAIGTSLPELATAVASARRGAVDLIVGNVFGSNIFNSLAVGGVAGVIGSGAMDESPRLSVLIMLAATVLALALGTIRGRYSRVDGVLLLLVYPVILVSGA